LKKKIVNITLFLIFISLGLWLFWFLYRDQDVDKLSEELNSLNYWWLILTVVCAILSHMSRAVRWQMLVKPLGYKTSFWNSFFSVMATHLANYVFPRLGEITRPTILKKYEGIPFTQSFGTIVLERIIDLIILFLLTLVVAMVEYKTVAEFIRQNPETEEKVLFILKILLFLTIAGIIALTVFLLYFRKRLKKFALYNKIAHLVKQFLEGIKTIRSLENLPLFIAHSLFIWFMYFCMTYFAFFAFDFTSHLGIAAGLTVFVMGSYGMVAPVQGGLGAWHVMVSKTLVIIGIVGATEHIQNENAELFALIVHGLQTLVILVVGSLSLALLPIINRKKTKHHE